MRGKPPLLTPKQYANLKEVHVQTVRRWIRQRRIPRRWLERVGGRLRIRADAPSDGTFRVER
jgi:excisionase family DNA binding protein